MANSNELLNGHVTLEVECIDRLYLNGYVGKLATSGGLYLFLSEHLGKPVPSPVILGQITQRFVEELRGYAARHDIPVIQFEHGERKDDRAHCMRQRRPVRDEVVFIGVAPEKAQAFSARKVDGRFWFNRDKTVYVNHYYIYLDDADFGPAFWKVCSYAPWAMKRCLNGHEWAKRQWDKRRMAYQTLDNGFCRCARPEKLQEICDSLGPDQIDRMFRKWLDRLPLPLTKKDRQAGYEYDVSVWQMEVSLTHIFDRPMRGREFFEEVIRDNLDLGRPDRVQLIFEKRVGKMTPGRFRTRVIQDGVNPSLHIEYKQCDLKQYFKEGRGLRTETTFRNANDFGINKGLSNLPYLQQVRFGNPRVMALFVALTLFQHLLNGFRHRDLRGHVAALLGTGFDDYTPNQMTYDLRRLLRKGIIYRQQGTNRYFLTPHGWKVSRLFARLEARVFRPATAAFGDDITGLPPPLRKALRQVDSELDALIQKAVPSRRTA
jgi:hypothetical protein